ncbi:hypothetical protein evm_005390 [Chilo suppressalis]|nr:hypothetical protein evm_005390 [Chilo suppressalis]
MQIFSFSVVLLSAIGILQPVTRACSLEGWPQQNPYHFVKRWDSIGSRHNDPGISFGIDDKCCGSKTDDWHHTIKPDTETEETLY